MSKAMLNSTGLFIKRLMNEQKKTKVDIIFHGGEPLLAGKNYYTYAIPYFFEILEGNVDFSIQSNLWHLDDELSKLFKLYNVTVGTSIDGPEKINDSQRGMGYYSKTLTGIELLRKQDLACGCIATFTKYSLENLEEIFNFFRSQELNFDIHAAIKPIDYHKNDKLFLNPTEFGEMLIKLLEMYLKHLPELKIGTLDTLIRNVSHKKSGVCTFSKCLGEYFAISPKGELYTCNRFVGEKDFCIGNILDIHSFSDITKSEAWKKQKDWQDWIDESCKGCLFKDYCNGGCPYSSFASCKGSFAKDPLCKSYQQIYTHIINMGIAEYFSDENMERLKQEQNINNEVQYQNTPILYLMRNYIHPFDNAQNSKKIRLISEKN